ncbi:ribonuclease BN/unknown domain fusion protein [Halomonas elongata]|uniref:YihY/virulence factor BrkB family protein n=1 Tax=Halomonas elongata TaxID=2746 RepID=A0A1B8P3I1_HALEL|nr:ribonuclease BN/unknown domain fusion protein [Halomonas elongata]
MSDSPASPSRRRLPLFVSRVACFGWRVLTSFLRNRGILLAGGVGYNVLLSIVPLFALLVVLLAGVVDERQLMGVLSIQVRHLTPAYAEVVLDAVRSLLDSRDAIGILGIPVLLVFSSFAFRMLEDALAIIFHAPDTHTDRSVWVSVLMPYAFMLVLGAGLLSLTLMVSLVNAVNAVWMALLGRELPLSGLSGRCST